MGRTSSFCQMPSPLTLIPDGGNKKASVSEQIGIVKISVNYSRPGVKGREGKIWNTPVAHYGFADLGYGTSKSSPWRAGANENTTVSFSHPVRIEGKDLAAGTYGFFISLGEGESTLIFSKINNSWGSFYYDASEDALRVTVKNQILDKSVEWLSYEFLDQTENSAMIAMSWEHRRIPFKVEVDVKETQIASFRNELRTTRQYFEFLIAANYCLRNNVELEQALAWVDRAISTSLVSEEFVSNTTKASLLIKLNRIDEANKAIAESLPQGNMSEVHYYGRQLIDMSLVNEAVKVLQYNYDKHPNEYMTNVGMARAMSAQGNYKKALTFAKSAGSKAPSPQEKANIEGLVKRLEDNKDINK